MNSDKKYILIKSIARKVNFLVAKGCAVFAAGTILITTILLTVDVVGRYFFGKPTMVAAEISGYLLVGLVFIGLVYTADVNRNIVVEIITSRLGSYQRKFHNVVLIFSIIFSGWLVWFTLEPVVMDFSLGTTSLTGTAIPIWMPSALIPLGFALLTINLSAKFILCLGNEDRQGLSND